MNDPGIYEKPKYPGKSIDQRRFETYMAFNSKLAPRPAPKPKPPKTEMEEAEEKWRKFYGLK